MMEFDPYKVTIKQLMRADGWYAVYRSDEASRQLSYVPLAVWALVEVPGGTDAPSQRVTGITFEGGDTRNQFCENRGNFLGYTKKDDPFAWTNADWEEEAHDLQKEEQMQQQAQIRRRQQDDQQRR